MYYALSVAVIIIIGACFAVFAKEDNYIVSFLNGYGYEVSEKPIERAEIRIPSPLDEVYEGYNKIQKKAGFDLKQYEGKNGIRYTYEVKNYPGNIEGVRANVIVIGGEIVGGDICTLSMDGFMHEFGGE
jgi:hypothetical protein